MMDISHWAALITHGVKYRVAHSSQHDHQSHRLLVIGEYLE